MTTVTIPEKEYTELQIQAELYQTLLRRLPKREWGIETYAPDRLREFLSEDRVDIKVARKVRAIIKSR